MSVQEIKRTAFASYLLSVPRSHALQHLRDCISQGEVGPMVWDLMEATEKRLGISGGRDLSETANEMLKTLEDA